MVEVKNLTKIIENNKIFNNLNIIFNTGNVNLVIGESGSGKTILLKILIGLIYPTTGTILYSGQSFIGKKYKEIQNFRTKIGVVFQGSALYDNLNVLDNVKFPLIFFNNNKEIIDLDKYVIKILDRVGISNKSIKKMPSELSGGMQKRVAIARAIVNNPLYLFIDEPNSGLDPITSKKIDDLIYEITKDYNMTTIINTHDINSLFNIGDSIYFLNNGKLEWEGDKKSIINSNNNNLSRFIRPFYNIKKYSM